MTTDKISMRAMATYEKQTGKNAFETLSKGEATSATDLIGMIFMYLYTTDNTVTLEKVENMTQSEIKSVVDRFKDAEPKQE